MQRDYVSVRRSNGQDIVVATVISSTYVSYKNVTGDVLVDHQDIGIASIKERCCWSTRKHLGTLLLVDKYNDS